MTQNMEWIKVSERMPEPFVTVIVDGGVALYTGYKWNTITGCSWPGETIMWEVTHWMPLPKVSDLKPTIVKRIS